MVHRNLRIDFTSIGQPHPKPAIGGCPASHLPSIEAHNKNIDYICDYYQSFNMSHRAPYIYP